MRKLLAYKFYSHFWRHFFNSRRSQETQTLIKCNIWSCDITVSIHWRTWDALTFVLMIELSPTSAKKSPILYMMTCGSCLLSGRHWLVGMHVFFNNLMICWLLCSYKTLRKIRIDWFFFCFSISWGIEILSWELGLQ